MRKKNLLFILVGMAVLPGLRAQELDAKITVLANRVPNSVDHKIFQTLQSSLFNFLNNRKWSSESFQNNEKIACNFLINIGSAGDNNTFQATMTVQAGRPVFNSSYQSPLINFADDAFTFLFSESAGRAVVAVPRSEELRFNDMCGARGLPVTRIGVVDGDSVEVQGEFTLPLTELRTAHEETIPALLA